MTISFIELRREIERIGREQAESEVMKEVVGLIRTRYDDFDADARREADRILDGAIQIGTANARRQIGSMPEGADKRSIARLIAQTEGGHVRAHDLMAMLEGKTAQTAPVVSASVGPFACALQVCADFLFEARRTAPSGKRDIVLHGLFMGLLDELLASFHLAQRAFASQAYAHLRTVEEVLEGIDLLTGDAALLDKWIDATTPEGERAIFKTIRSRVGQGLATDDSRKLYAFLSALGPHSQFRSVQARTALKQEEDGSRTATVFFLGSPMQTEAANVLTVRSAVAIAHSVARAFSGALLVDDVNRELNQCRQALAELVQAHLIPVAEQMRLTAEQAQLVLAHRVAPPM